MGKQQSMAATVEEVLGPVDPKLRELNAKLRRARDAGWNVFAPSEIRYVPPLFRVHLESVQIDPRPEKGDVYQSQGKLHLKRRALVRLSEAFGIDWDATRSGRIDDGRDPMRAEWKQAARVLDVASGQWRDLSASYAFDINAREAESRAKWEETRRKEPQKAKTAELFERDLRTERLAWLKFKLMRAETGAIERVVAGLGVERSYFQPQLEKLFLIVRLVVDPGDDADGKRMLLAVALKSAGELYGLTNPRRPEAPPAPEEDEVPAVPAPAAPALATGSRNGNGAAPPQTPVAPTPPPPLPAPPEAADSFEVLDRAAQIETLGSMAARKGYLIGTHHGPIEQWTGDKCLRFYDHLRAMPDLPVAGDDACPF